MSPTYAVLFKTHVWDDYSERQLARLRQICRSGVIFIFKDQTSSFEQVTADERVLNASENQCVKLGLPHNPPGRLFWYNNDYPLYYFWELYPQFEYVVSIEYDVGCSIDLDLLIESLALNGVDCIAEPIATPITEWHWAATGRDVYGPGEPLRHALFCFAVFSKRAVETLYQRRRMIGLRLLSGQIATWPYGELFMATEIANAGFVMRALSDYGDAKNYSWWPPVLEDKYLQSSSAGFAHPVLDAPRFIASALRFESDLETYFDSASPLRRRLELCPKNTYVPLLFEELRRRGLVALITRLKRDLPTHDHEALQAHFNVARGKHATQSTISPWSRVHDPSGDAIGAVSGVVTGSYGFHTREEIDPWWMVDLATAQDITEIRIYNRLDVRHRARHLAVWLAISGMDWKQVFRRDDSHDFGGADGDPLRLTFSPGLRGRFVRIQLSGLTLLHLDEVQIFAEPAPAN